MNVPESIYQLENRKIELKENINKKEKLITENKNVLEQNKNTIYKLNKEIRQIKENIIIKEKAIRELIKDKNILKKELNTIDKRFKQKVSCDRYWSKNNPGQAFINIRSNKNEII